MEYAERLINANGGIIKAVQVKENHPAENTRIPTIITNRQEAIQITETLKNESVDCFYTDASKIDSSAVGLAYIHTKKGVENKYKKFRLNEDHLC